ncbi:MAG TPA: AAA family ATPase, partial [Ramlibacter sp.]|nr:AAA family ATPase [Ramlibacter sp.]
MTLPSTTPSGGPTQPGSEAARELLYASDTARIFRVPGPAGASGVICKEPLGPKAQERLRHEHQIIARLAEVEGVPRLACEPHPAAVLALEDCGGISLAQVLRTERLEFAALLALALQLAKIVAGVHRAGVIHQDINPANILLAGAQRQPVLIDFDLATLFAEQQPGFTHHVEIAGTLAYLAPEQTGRTSRTVDQRADLYALGATFYELATGRPPFDATDPLQLIHDHLVREPVPPVWLDARVPQGLSAIILRLLAKEPDARYQSAHGLVHDLSLLGAALQRGDNTVVALGERDFAERLTPPSRLVGRHNEIARLQGAFESALQGGPRGVLVSGAPGVGKTTLVNELRTIVAARRGWFLSGKFDSQRQDVASDGVYQTIRALGRMLLAEPEAQLQAMRERIALALGAGGCRLLGKVPEIALLLGQKPAMAEVDLLTVKEQLVQVT